MKGTLRFLSLFARWTTLSVCCAFAISGLSHLSAFSQYRRDFARQRPYYQSVILRAKTSSAIQRLRTMLVNQSTDAAFDFLLLPLPQASSSKIVFASNRDGSMQIYSSGQIRT